MTCVLVVEDHDILRTVTALTLQQAGYATVEARTGQEALQCLAQQTGIDLMLTELNLPEMGGQRLIEAVQTDYPHIPIVVLSSFPKELWGSDTAVQQVAQYLLKPVKQQHLLDVVQMVLTSALIVS